MIYAKLTDAPAYRGIHPRLDRALALLNPDFLAAVGHERQELEGEALTVTRFDVETSVDEARLFEYHARYIDIFVEAAGCERVDLASPEQLTVQAHSGDYWGCAGQAEQSLILRPDRFLVLFPGEGHRPGMAAGEPAPIGRIVFKILYKET